MTVAETHEVTQLETANRKIYVLDTNVLLHDPTAITTFAEHQVVIPMTVLEELDHIKDRRDKSVSREARCMGAMRIVYGTTVLAGRARCRDTNYFIGSREQRDLRDLTSHQT